MENAARKTKTKNDSCCKKKKAKSQSLGQLTQEEKQAYKQKENQK